MAKKHNDLNSLAKSLEPEINRLNSQILAKEKSALESQATRLLGDVNSMWQGYEKSYQPTTYRRSGAVSNGFGLSSTRTVSEGIGVKLEVDLVLDDGYMWHGSLFGGKRGHAFMLISEGWEWQGGLGGYKGAGNSLGVEHFTYFDGIGIVDTLIKTYNTKDYDFTFYYEGEEYNGKQDRGNRSFTK